MKYVLVAASLSPKLEAYLREKNYELVSYETLLDKELNRIEGIVTSNKLILNADKLATFNQLKWIARLGSGMEIIDTNYCGKNNIVCMSSPKGIANAVAEHTVGMLLSLLHRIVHANNEINTGMWLREPNRGTELASLRVGIIGYGHTGSALAKKLEVFTQHIFAYDKYKHGFGSSTVKEVSLQEIYQQVDIVSFHVPLNRETRHYYNDEFLNKVAKPHILINTSRGAIAHTQTILQGLQSGKLIGACLDVLEEEDKMNEILKQPNHVVNNLLKHNVILTPHIAGYSHQATEAMSQEIIEQLQAILP